MKIAMIGTGYVGLVSGACFAEFGAEVVCVDMDADKIDCLNRGEIPIYEPELDTTVEKGVRGGRLSFTTDLAAAVRSADSVFIAVGTPSRRGDGHADLSFVYAAAEEVAAALDGYTVIVTKSTVPVGTGDEVEAVIRDARPDAEFDVVSNPEFLREGAAVRDFMRPDRVVIGAHGERARDVMRELYRPLFLIETPIIFTARRTAELIKYAANTYLATKITFINEIADLCEAVGADVQDVAKGIGLDGRIGSKFLHAGPGYGGSCFPKDTLALVRTAQSAGSPIKIVEAVVAVNAARKKNMAEKIIAASGGDVDGKRIAVLGLTFKPDTDDIREAPALEMVAALLAAGARVQAYDPAAMAHSQAQHPGLICCDDPYEAAQGADAVVLMTEWNEFRNMDLPRILDSAASPRFLDCRNIYDPQEMASLGFEYVSIGRATRRPDDGIDAMASWMIRT